MDGIGGDMLTMYLKTPAPSSPVTQSSSVEVTSDQSTEGVTSPSTEISTPPPEESESVESIAHLLLPPLLRVGPNVLQNHHRNLLKKRTKTIKCRLNDTEQCF